MRLWEAAVLVTPDPTIASYADRILFLQDGFIYSEYENQAGKENVDEILLKFRESQKSAQMERRFENA